MSKVSDLPEITTVEDIDEIYVVDNSEAAGSRDKRITGANLKNSLITNPIASNVAYERSDIAKKDIAVSSDNVESALTDLDDRKMSVSGDLPMEGDLDLGNNDITGVAHINTPISIDLDINAASPSRLEGRLFYDKDEHSLALFNDNSDVVHQVGQEHLIRVFNNSGSVIGNGVPVYVTGTEELELRATVGLARADDPTTSKVIGVTTSLIPNNSFGYITRLGIVNNIDTSPFVDGDAVYLSENISGGITTDTPTQGNYVVLLGYIAHADSSNGRLLVDINAALSNSIGDANTVTTRALKGSPGSIPVGSVVYLSGFGTDRLVELANADSSSTMPGFGIVRETITDTVPGLVTTFGLLENINTSSYNVGDPLYVNTVDGTLTNIRPTGTALVQKVAIVTKVGFTDGIIEVFGAGRSNALPNLPTNNIWRGDSNSVPESVDFDAEVANNTSVAANTAKVSADGSVTTHSDVVSAGSGSIITTAERSKLSKLDVGYLQYCNSALISTSSTTFVDMSLVTDLNSTPNSYFTKVDATTLRADFTGKIKITLKVSAYSDTNNRSGEFGIQYNTTDLTYSQMHILTQNSIDRKNGAEVEFILPVSTNDTIKGRFRSPEGALIQIGAQHAILKVEVYSLG